MTGKPPNDAPGLPFDPAEDDEFGEERRAPFVPQPGTRARGRPVGARGKTAAQLSRYAAAKGLRDPGIMMLEFANADPVELMQWINGQDAANPVSLAWVMARQLEVADKVHPYFRGKVQAEGAPPGDLPVLVIGGGPVGAVQTGTVRARRMAIVDARPEEVADFSGKSEAVTVPSHETEAGDEG